MSDESPGAVAQPDQPTSATVLPWWPAVVTIVAMSAWPFLALTANNPGEAVDAGLLAGWWLAMLVPALALLLGAMLVDRRFGRWTGGMLGLVLWLLWSLQTTTALRTQLGVEKYGDTGWWIVVALAALLAAEWPMRHAPVQGFVAVVAVLLSASSVFLIVANGSSADATQPAALNTDGPSPSAAPDAPAGSEFQRTNNVWFLMADALAGADYLLESGGYDSSAFEQAMEEDGFEIQRNATANYPLTALALSATLSMEYTWTEVEDPKKGPFIMHMAGANATVSMMRANGYSYAHAYPGFYVGSKCRGFEDICIGNDTTFTETHQALASLTPLGHLITRGSRETDIAVTNDASHQVRRILDADLASPSYNFVHALNPHPPILRDANCGVRLVPLKLGDWGDGPEYFDAVRCQHLLLKKAVDLILADDPDALIIVQGDHGPRLGTMSGTTEDVLMDGEMYFSIFSAFHLPDACDDLEIPQEFSPVNTMRIVRACLEDTEPDLLENRQYPIFRDRG